MTNTHTLTHTIALEHTHTSTNIYTHTRKRLHHTYTHTREKGYTTHIHTHAKKVTPHKYAPILTHSEEKRMKNLSKSIRINGLQPRTHGNAHRLPKNTLFYECTKGLVNYASQNALVLPGRVPSFQNQLLPSSTSFGSCTRSKWMQSVPLAHRRGPFGSCTRSKLMQSVTEQ